MAIPVEKQAEVVNFLNLAEARIKLIDYLLANKLVYTPVEPRKLKGATKLCKLYISGIDVTGVDNIGRAWDHIKTPDDVNNGNRLVLVSNHLRDADHSVKRYIIEKLGFPGLASRLFFLGGLKMIERPEIRRLMPAENTVFVITPGDIHKLLEARRWGMQGLLSTEQVDIVKKYEQQCRELIKASDKAIDDQMQQGKVLAVCPEGTRSRDELGRITRAPKEIDKLFPVDEKTWVLSLMTSGTENIMTLEDKFRLERTRICMVVGCPYPSKDIHTVDTKNIFPGGSPARKADIVMARLAVLNWDLVKLEEWEFYNKVCGNYNPGLTNGRYHSGSFFDVFQRFPLKFLERELFKFALGRKKISFTD